MSDSWSGYSGPTFDETNADNLIKTWPGNGSPGSRGPAATAPAEPGPAAQPAPSDPLAGNPAYLAFKRALGLEQQNAETNADTQTQLLGQKLKTATSPELQWMGHQNDLANKQIAGSMEARGLLRSGETETNLANQGANFQHATDSYAEGVNNQIQAIQQALAQQKQGFAARGTDARLNTADQMALADQQDAITKALTDAMAKGSLLPNLSGLIPGLGTAAAAAAAPANLQRFNLSPSEAFIVQHESGGNVNAKNPSSGAFGIGQLNPSSGTLQEYAAKLGVDPYTTDPAQQIALMRTYIADRYGSADAAAAHEKAFRWY